MKRFLKPWLVAVALVIAGVTQAFAGATPLGALTVTPDEGFPGDPFTVSGQDCPEQNQLGAAGVGSFAGGTQTFEVTVTMTGPGATGVTYPLGTATPDEGGNWTLETNVPEEAPPSETEGDYTINADCVGSFGTETSLSTSGLSTFAQGFSGSYDPHAFTVLGEGEVGPVPPAPEEEEESPEVEAEAEAADPVEVQPAFAG